MKKVLLVILALFFITGCTRVDKLSYEEIMSTLASEKGNQNIYRTGYKYYLPRGMKVEDATLFNEAITDNKSIYYLYIDAVSYYNKVKNEYRTTTEAYYSKGINYEDKFGYIEINLLKNEKYLIEIMYNYAKIEVIVEKGDINISLLNAINILKSIRLNDAVITNLLGSDILNFAEEEFNIFNTTSSDSEYLKKDDTYYEEEQVLPDTDLIN